MRTIAARDLFRRSNGDDLASRRATLGPEVDDVVRIANDIEVVFDHDDGVSTIDEAIDEAEELFDIDEM